MFKRVIQSLTKVLGPSAKAAEVPPPAAPEAAPRPQAPAAAPEREPAAPPPATSTPKPRAFELPRFKAVPDELPRPAEEMCGITSSMSKDQIRERLAFLYRRYNRATSSLNADLRNEAETMLDAIVIIREKHFGVI